MTRLTQEQFFKLIREELLKIWDKQKHNRPKGSQITCDWTTFEITIKVKNDKENCKDE